MVFILFLLILCSLTLEVTLLNSFTKLSVFAQQICANALPNESTYFFFYKAIVCGEKVTEKNLLINLFMECSLIHIVVVSGSHLILLNQLLVKLRIKNDFLQKGVLLSFCFFTGFQAPTIRAYFQILLQKMNLSQRKNWSSLQVQLYAGMLLLFLFPEWILSLSLILSAVCALAIDLAKNQSQLRQHIFIYILIFLPISAINSPHPASILANLFLAPFLGLCLFPLSLLLIPFPNLYPATDLLLKGLELILSKLWIFSSLPIENHKISKAWLWTYYFLLILFFNFYRQRQERKKYVDP